MNNLAQTTMGKWEATPGTNGPQPYCKYRLDAIDHDWQPTELALALLGFIAMHVTAGYAIHCPMTAAKKKSPDPKTEAFCISQIR